MEKYKNKYKILLKKLLYKSMEKFYDIIFINDYIVIIRGGGLMDKIAVISDIHGNIPALDAVLNDIKKRKIERIMCLGDIVGKGPSSCEAVDSIRKNCEVILKGNWDCLISERYESEKFDWHYRKLGIERINYLKNLPIYKEFYLSGKLIRLCHAAPWDVFYRVQSTSPIDEKIKLFKPVEGGDKADIIGYGDVHCAYVQSFKGKMIFNSGSVGNPLELTMPSYAIIEGNYNDRNIGGFSISVIRVEYDMQKAINDARESDMPDCEDYINELKTAKYRGLK